MFAIKLTLIKRRFLRFETVAKEFTLLANLLAAPISAHSNSKFSFEIKRLTKTNKRTSFYLIDKVCNDKDHTQQATASSFGVYRYREISFYWSMLDIRSTKDQKQLSQNSPSLKSKYILQLFLQDRQSNDIEIENYTPWYCNCSCVIIYLSDSTSRTSIFT